MASTASPAELLDTVRNFGLWSTLGWADIKFRYRRTILGPFWLVLSTGATVLAIGVLYAELFHNKTSSYIPFLACGMIIWSFVNVTIVEGCNVFITASPIIKSSSIPLSVHVFRLMWRNVVVFVHGFAIIIATWIYYRWALSPSVLLVIPGLMILSVFLFGSVLFSGVICTRFRDLPQIVMSLLQLLFFLSPVIWVPSDVIRSSPIVWLNPFYSLIEIIRAPILGEPIDVHLWLVALVSTATVLAAGLAVYRKYRRLVPYWL